MSMQCKSNLRQFGLVEFVYAEDNDHLLVMATPPQYADYTRWPEILYTYFGAPSWRWASYDSGSGISDTWLCPADPTPSPSNPDLTVTSYTKQAYSFGKRLDGFPTPTKTFSFADSTLRGDFRRGYDAEDFAYRHPSESINLSYLDGHVDSHEMPILIRSDPGGEDFWGRNHPDGVGAWTKFNQMD